MARGSTIHDDLCAYLRSNGTTRTTADGLAAQMGVVGRTINYALTQLRAEGLIVERWDGPKDRTIIWVGSTPDLAAAEEGPVSVGTVRQPA